MCKITFVLIATFSGLSAFADQDSADLARSVFQQNIQTTPVPVSPASTGATKEAPTTGKATGTPITTAATPSQNSINPSAAKGQSSQGAGSAINQAAGQALMAAGSALMASPPTRPAGAALMAMGVLAMMQSGHDAGAAGESAATYDASSFGNPNSANSATTAAITDPATGKSGFNPQSIQGATKMLADNGYTVTPAGIKNPDGSFTPASAFSSPGAMSAAGMDPGAIREATKVTAALNDEINKLKVSGVGLNTGGGMGGEGQGGGGSSEDSSDKLHVGRFSNPFAMNAAARRNLIAGKTVMFDGEPIGVRGQNIFDMIHTAYQKKREGHNFIEGEASQPTMVRGPASLPRAQPGPR